VTPAHPAVVIYADGRLAIAADNSSLNQVLREIAHKTGMTITGGVTEERVFGTYGPGPLGKVLASLLDGTGSNMLLREGSPATPAELVLTPITAGPTPPNPDAAAYNDDEPLPPPSFVPQPVPLPGQPPGAASAYGPGFNPVTGASPGPGPGAQYPGSTEQQSPNGVKTPQQIFQQLQQLQQQQPAKPN
jgi:hypothetical protein